MEEERIREAASTMNDVTTALRAVLTNRERLDATTLEKLDTKLEAWEELFKPRLDVDLSPMDASALGLFDIAVAEDLGRLGALDEVVGDAITAAEAAAAINDTGLSVDDLMRTGGLLSTAHEAAHHLAAELLESEAAASTVVLVSEQILNDLLQILRDPEEYA